MSGESLRENQIYVSNILILQGLLMIPVFFLGREIVSDYIASPYDPIAISYAMAGASVLFLFVFPLFEGISVRRQTRDFIADASWWYYLSLGLGVFYLISIYTAIIYGAPLLMLILSLIYLIPGWIGLQFVEKKSAERRAQEW